MSTHVPTILVGLGISLAMGVVEVGTERAYGQPATLASLESRVTKLEQSVFATSPTVENRVAQYVLTLVALPPTEAELQDQRIRDRNGMQPRSPSLAGN